MTDNCTVCISTSQKHGKAVKKTSSIALCCLCNDWWIWAHFPAPVYFTGWLPYYNQVKFHGSNFSVVIWQRLEVYNASFGNISNLEIFHITKVINNFYWNVLNFHITPQIYWWWCISFVFITHIYGRWFIWWHRQFLAWNDNYLWNNCFTGLLRCGRFVLSILTVLTVNTLTFSLEFDFYFFIRFHIMSRQWMNFRAATITFACGFLKEPN